MAFKFETIIDYAKASKIYALYVDDAATEGEKAAAYSRLEAIAKKGEKTIDELINKINGKKETNKEFYDKQAKYYQEFNTNSAEFYNHYSKDYKEPINFVTDVDLAVLFALRVIKNKTTMTLNESTFIEDMYMRFRDYGFNMRITTRQRQFLQTIYNKYRNKQNG